MRRSIQTVIQIAFLIVFVGLIFWGKVQIWVLFFLIGILATVFVGRVYCGWICPIHTVASTVTRIKRKLKIKDHPIPKWAKSPWTRYSLLALFLGLAVIAKIKQISIPVLPILFVVGILLTLIFPETLWHRYLCPYGTLLRFPAGKAKKFLSIDPLLCSNCGACARICPTDTIIRIDQKHIINKTECLVCYACQDQCPKDAIH